MNKDQEAAAHAAADAVLAGRATAYWQVQPKAGENRAELTVTADKPEIAEQPSFFKDVLNGVVGIAKTIWHVPAAQGAIATLVVRAGVPATVVAVLVPIIDALVK
ncbi:hypothetical protein [Sphingomonas sp. BAUL-RG-20F-R05-02]|uniref:hypothetical protein n=1 Tax=Sphingomonas sp. BAUL-RG-20F-R05-02 TaxID=2914830 RepID=UPI001F57C617|nr:hypothetical protein [Sphingomonas sp. BAUL-RG-20F-R05-02]